MSEEEVEKKRYEIRTNIEEQMFALYEAGFSIEEIQDFVLGVVDDIREEELDE